MWAASKERGEHKEEEPEAENGTLNNRKERKERKENPVKETIWSSVSLHRKLICASPSGRNAGAVTKRIPPFPFLGFSVFFAFFAVKIIDAYFPLEWCDQ